VGGWVDRQVVGRYECIYMDGWVGRLLDNK
jgi:hypothetical protein